MAEPTVFSVAVGATTNVFATCQKIEDQVKARCYARGCLYLQDGSLQRYLRAAQQSLPELADVEIPAKNEAGKGGGKCILKMAS
jgi:hypothetical protein